MSDPPPLSFDDAIDVLRRIVGQRIVLVGGQAVNYWAERYAHNVKALRAAMPFTSKDIDFQGLRGDVEECARRLDGTALLASFDDHTPNSGIVRFKDKRGHDRTIDFLASVAGVDDKQLLATAVPVPLPRGAGEVLVMHPTLCLESRAHNVAWLPGYDGPPGRKQLRAAIFCAREFIAEALSAGEVRQALGMSERIFKLALNRTGIVLAVDKRFDVFRAVRPHRALPMGFRKRRYPQMVAELAKERARVARRRK
ncbi:MAG: hypothetical protein IT375_36000 [Polyangiaceae bacterium]|nr:hypothetical protein [Polyangiaceae bacterium]